MAGFADAPGGYRDRVRKLAVLIAGVALGAASLANASASAGANWRTLPDGKRALMLRTASPSWLTPALLRAARSGPVRAPDVPASGYVGIRPGSEEIAPFGCTMNYVFKKDGALGIGTAGHCVDRVGEVITLLTLEPDSKIPVIVDVGRVAVRVFDPRKLAPDFAIIAISPKFYPWVFPTQAQECSRSRRRGSVPKSCSTTGTALVSALPGRRAPAYRSTGTRSRIGGTVRPRRVIREAACTRAVCKRPGT
jgi:hypothetical protein